LKEFLTTEEFGNFQNELKLKYGVPLFYDPESSGQHTYCTAHGLIHTVPTIKTVPPKNAPFQRAQVCAT